VGKAERKSKIFACCLTTTNFFEEGLTTRGVWGRLKRRVKCLHFVSQQPIFFEEELTPGKSKRGVEREGVGSLCENLKEKEND